MGKRILAVFCLLALLAGCTAPAAPETTAPQTAAPTGTEPPEPTERPAPVVQPGGFTVHTDYSQYSAYRPAERKYTRLSEGPLTEFVPGDYGLVYPYTEALQYDASPDGYTGFQGKRYGLADASGRILTDGIYYAVTPLFYVPEYGSYEDREPIGLWTVGQNTVERWIEVDDGTLYPIGTSRYGLVSADGSFATPCEYYYVETIEGRAVCRRADSAIDCDVFDRTGRLLITGADLFEPDCDWTTLSFGEGLYVAGSMYNDGRRVCWFVDEEGNRVLGPYYGASAFSGGLACVRVGENDEFGYIDRSGAWVIPPEYELSAAFRDGRVVQRQGDTGVVLSDRGEVLFTAPDSLFETHCGYESRKSVAIGWTGEWETHQIFFDRDGNELFSAVIPYGESPWYCVDGNTLFRDGGCLGSVVRRLDSGEEITLPSVSFLERSVLWADGVLCEGCLAYLREGGSVFYPEDFQRTLPVEPKNPYGGPDYFETPDQLTGETWRFFWEGSSWRAEDPAGVSHPLRLAGQPRVIGGLVYAETTDRCVCLKPDGAVVFSFPLDDQD